MPPRADSVIVLGAGALGTAAARELARRGRRVVLIDRKPPASETSYGNAGIVSESAAVPFNNPALRHQLGGLLFGKNPSLRCHLPSAAAALPPLLKFLRLATAASAGARARLLHPLIRRGWHLHKQWLADSGNSALIRHGGWLKLYRSEKSFARSEPERQIWRALGVPHTLLHGKEINDYLAGARPIFPRAVLIENAYGIMTPGAAIAAYARAFTASGGLFQRGEAETLARQDGFWQVTLTSGRILSAAQVVVALGPWSRAFLARLGVKLPLFFERGGHRHFHLSGGAPPPPLAFTDTDGGYSALLQGDGTLRITSGVYLAGLNAPPPRAQLNAAEKNLRAAFGNIGAASGEDWFGARPTLPDCLPLIGECAQKGLWLAAGFQHIGLMASPAAGESLAQLMCKEIPPAKLAPFSPTRFTL